MYGEMANDKRGRGKLKYQVTVSIGKLAAALSDPDTEVEAVRAALKVAEDNFGAFAAYHRDLHATFNPSEARVSEAYFKEAKREHDKVVRQAVEWLKCKEEEREYTELESEDEDDEEVPKTPGVSMDQSMFATLMSRLDSIQAQVDRSTSVPTASTPFKAQIPSVAPRLNVLSRIEEDTAIESEAWGLQPGAGLGSGETLLAEAKKKDGRKESGGAVPDVRPKETYRGDPDAGKAAEQSGDRRLIEVVTTALSSMATSFDQLANVSVANSTQQRKEEQAFKVPKFKLFKFSGQAIDYWPWIRAFETQVEQHIQDPGTLLGTLMFNVHDEVREMLQSCIVNRSPAEAYARARELLVEQFGRKEDVAHAWLNKFYSYPEVRTVTELLKLHNLLLNCRETLQSVDQVDEFQTKTNIVMIVKKLPMELRVRWQQWAVDVSETFDRKAGLNDLIKFLKRIHKEKSDPVYGGELVTTGKDKGGAEQGQVTHRQQGHRRAAYSTQQNLPPPKEGRLIKCVLCNTDHHTFRCEKFRALDADTRNKLTRDSGACINCFNPSHRVRQCRSEHLCKKCNKKHHTLLHFDRPSGNNDQYNNFSNPSMFQTPGATPGGSNYLPEYGSQDVRMQYSHGGSMGEQVHQTSTEQGAAPTPFVAHAISGGKVGLPLVPVLVHGKGREVVTYALLDTGSTCTLATNRLLDMLGVDYVRRSTTMTTVVGTRVPIDYRCASFQISDIERSERHQLNGVMGRPELNLSLACKAFPCDTERWPHLKGVQIRQVDVDSVDLLIGQDHPDLLRQGEKVYGPCANDPYGIETKFGWYIGGPLSKQDPETGKWVGFTDRGDRELAAKCDQFWQVDGMPVKKKVTEMSYDDEKVLKMWKGQVQRVGSQYMLPIPFKQDPLELPFNRAQAVQRLRSQEKRFRRDPSYFQKYCKAICKNMDDRYAEPVDKSRDHLKKGKIFYLSHHAVFHPRKPDDPRVVFDCAALWNGMSLNDFVFQGPDLLNRLIVVLLCFRQDRVAILGDIQGMFNMILVLHAMRDCLRFLWYKDNEVGGEIVEYRMTTHLFGGVWSPSCANFVLKQVVEDHGEEYSEEVREMVRKLFYVDDGMKSTSTVETATDTLLGVRSLLSKGHFNFTKLLSNRAEVMEKLPREHWAKGVTLEMIREERGYVHHMLGCPWLPASDRLVYRPELPNKEKSKRGVLSTTASIYDPLGLVSPVVIKAKVIFQDATRRKLPWDQQLDEDLLADWNDWVLKVVKLNEVEFPRCLLPGDMSLEEPGLTFELHIFSDAARRAYGANAYLRVLKYKQPVGAALVMSKGRLAPLKQLSIPRLELLGAYTSVQLDCLLREALTIPISRTVFWVDSTIVLCYVFNTGTRHPTFEANRLGFIWENSDPKQWHHVPTSVNPADIVSRGCDAEELKDNLLWSRGPMFLMQTEEHWPKVPENAVKKEAKRIEEINAAVFALEAEAPARAECYDKVDKLISHYSSWYRLKKAVSYYQSMIKWRQLKKKRPPPRVTVSTLEGIGKSILRYTQKTRLVEVAAAKRKQYQQLFPVEIEGLMCVGGRIAEAKVHPHMKFPIVVPEGHVARLLAREAHLQTVHGGRRRTLEEARKKYWLLKGGKVVRCTVSKCIPCRKLKAPPMQPRMQGLPEARVSGEQPAFSNCGIDYFGPIAVKVGRSRQKRYGCLMTCLLTRAVHLEVAHSLDTDSCMKAIDRFAARRRMPAILWSDNGTNFVGAERGYREALARWNEEDIEGRLRQKGCDWRFNTPAASHQGGVWERQIRTAREILLKLSEHQILTDESLTTLFCLVEDVMNNRPLVPVSDDPGDLTALTPNHLLKPEAPVRLPPDVLDEEKGGYRSRWRQVQFMTNIFWRRWTAEYLPLLQVRPKWYRGDVNLKVGDLVTIMDEHTPRNFWPLARVCEVYPGKDGVVRNVRVKTSRGLFRRPVQKICLLEAAVD